MEEAEKSWCKIRGADRIKPLLDGVPLKDGLPAPDNRLEQQKLAA
jgi:putative transposase